MKQDARHGNDGGIIKFSKPANMIVMPWGKPCYLGKTMP